MFLELTVNTIGQTTAPPFAPRQQLVANPFALRAKVADLAKTVGPGSVFANSLTASSVSGGTLGAIADASITAADIANATITGAKLAAGTVTTTQLADNSITWAKIVDGTINSADLQDNTITSADILDGTIGTADMAGTLGFWNRSGTNLSWTAGNAGIGIAAPATRLHVKGSGDVVRVEGGGAGTANVGYISFRDSSGARIGYVGDNASADSNVALAADNGDVLLIGTTVRANGKSVVAGEENLRIVRGTVNSNGTVSSGTGFTVSRTLVGVYTINFSPAFAGNPTVTANAVFSGPNDPRTVVIDSRAPNSVKLTTLAGDRQDLPFDFIAVGAR
jgi:hypothetical protein